LFLSSMAMGMFVFFLTISWDHKNHLE
jgi:hypothetical protein